MTQNSFCSIAEHPGFTKPTSNNFHYIILNNGIFFQNQVEESYGINNNQAQLVLCSSGLNSLKHGLQ